MHPYPWYMVQLPFQLRIIAQSCAMTQALFVRGKSQSCTKRRRLLTDKSRSHSSSPEEAKRKIFRSVSPNGETQGKIGKYRESSVFRRALLATFNSFDTDDSLEVNKVPPLICFDEEYFISYPRALMAANSFDEDEIANSTGVKIDGNVVYPEVFVGEGGKILFEI